MPPITNRNIDGSQSTMPTMGGGAASMPNMLAPQNGFNPAWQQQEVDPVQLHAEQVAENQFKEMAALRAKHHLEREATRPYAHDPVLWDKMATRTKPKLTAGKGGNSNVPPAQAASQQRYGGLLPGGPIHGQPQSGTFLPSQVGPDGRLTPEEVWRRFHLNPHAGFVHGRQPGTAQVDGIYHGGVDPVTMERFAPGIDYNAASPGDKRQLARMLAEFNGIRALRAAARSGLSPEQRAMAAQVPVPGDIARSDFAREINAGDTADMANRGNLQRYGSTPTTSDLGRVAAGGVSLPAQQYNFPDRQPAGSGGDPQALAKLLLMANAGGGANPQMAQLIRQAAAGNPEAGARAKILAQKARVMDRTGLGNRERALSMLPPSQQDQDYQAWKNAPGHNTLTPQQYAELVSKDRLSKEPDAQFRNRQRKQSTSREQMDIATRLGRQGRLINDGKALAPEEAAQLSPVEKAAMLRDNPGNLRARNALLDRNQQDYTLTRNAELANRLKKVQSNAMALADARKFGINPAAMYAMHGLGGGGGDPISQRYARNVMMGMPPELAAQDANSPVARNHEITQSLIAAFHNAEDPETKDELRNALVGRGVLGPNGGAAPGRFVTSMTPKERGDIITQAINDNRGNPNAAYEQIIENGIPHEEALVAVRERHPYRGAKDFDPEIARRSRSSWLEDQGLAPGYVSGVGDWINPWLPDFLLPQEMEDRTRGIPGKIGPRGAPGFRTK